MSDRHLPHWPKTQPRHLSLPNTQLFYNAEVPAARYPDKPFLVFYDTPITKHPACRCGSGAVQSVKSGKVMGREMQEQAIADKQQTRRQKCDLQTR